MNGVSNLIDLEKAWNAVKKLEGVNSEAIQKHIDQINKMKAEGKIIAPVVHCDIKGTLLKEDGSLNRLLVGLLETLRDNGYEIIIQTSNPWYEERLRYKGFPEKFLPVVGRENMMETTGYDDAYSEDNAFIELSIDDKKPHESFAGVYADHQFPDELVLE